MVRKGRSNDRKIHSESIHYEQSACSDENAANTKTISEMATSLPTSDRRSYRRVDVLLGMDNCEFHIHREVWREREIEEIKVPYAVRTLLGWIVLGVLLNDSQVNLIQVATDDDNAAIMSINDEKALRMVDDSFDILIETMTVAVPFKNNKDTLYMNKTMAKKRLYLLGENLREITNWK